MEKVSVIVPIYNSEKSLDRCINSILNQTYSELEIILVDDGSTDNSFKIYDYYARQDNRIQIIKQHNKGVSAARNIGINLSSGKYIFFVDSDDFIEKNLIKNIISKIITEKSDIVFFGYEKHINDRVIRKIPQIPINIDKSEMVFSLFKQNLFGFTCNKIFKADIVRNNNLYFSEKIDLYEDQYFFCEYIKFAKKISISSQTGYYYIIGNNTLSTKFRNNILSLQDQMFLYLERFTKEIDLDSQKRNILLVTYIFKIYYSYTVNNIRTMKNNNSIKESIELFYQTKMFDYYKRNKCKLENLNIKQKFLKILLDLSNYNLLVFFLKVIVRMRNKNDCNV